MIPKLPVNIVDLGLIYTVTLSPGRELQTSLPEATRAGRDDHDLAGLPIPRHDYGDRCVTGWQACLKSAKPWSTWCGNRRGHRIASARRHASNWVLLKRSLRSHSFFDDGAQLLALNRELAHKLFKAA